MKKLRHRQLNNEGFSLVEVLVAIVVLSILSVVLIQGFSSTAMTNMKSKKLQSASEIAQNTAEKYGAMSITELNRQAGVTVSRAGSKDEIFIYDFETKGSNEQTFHVKVVLNPNTNAALNDAQAPVLNNMYSENCKYWMREITRYDLVALQTIKGMQHAQTLPKRREIQRITTVDIDLKPVYADGIVNDIEYTYTLSRRYELIADRTIGVFENDLYTSSDERIEGTISRAQTNGVSLYIIYTPFDDTENIQWYNDKVNIVCHYDEDCNWLGGKVPVFFVYQGNTNISGDGRLDRNNIIVTDDSERLDLHTNALWLTQTEDSIWNSLTSGGTLKNENISTIYSVNVYVGESPMSAQTVGDTVSVSGELTSLSTNSIK